METIKDTLYGFTSDSAAVMLGQKSGVATLLAKIVKNNLYITHCFAHKLQLALTHSFRGQDNLKENFEKFINNICSFYNYNAFKRKESLIHTAEVLGKQFYELNYIYPIR